MKNDLVHIDLRENTPWVMGIAGLVKWFTWQPDNVFVVSKTHLKKGIVEDIISASKKGHLEHDVVSNIIDKKFEPNDAVSVQKYLRTSSEDYLNREFDIFFSLLPSIIINKFFSHVFKCEYDIMWNVVGNSGDFEDSMEMKFMQIDTIAYAPSINNLVAMELKNNAKIAYDQIKKYCFMAAYMEYKKKVDENVIFKLLFISPDRYTVSEFEKYKDDTIQQIKEKDFPQKKVSVGIMEQISSRATEILERLQIESITWQQLGDYFHDILLGLSDDPYIETHKKLISGFLESLEKKTYNNQSRLYIKKTACR